MTRLAALGSSWNRLYRLVGNAPSWCADVLIAATVVLAAAATIAGAAWYGETRQQDGLLHLTERAEYQARLLRIQWTSLLQRAEALHGMAREIAIQLLVTHAPADSFADVERAMRGAIAHSGGDLMQASLIGTDGVVAWSTLPYGPMPVDLRDRDHVRAILDRGLDFYVSAPVFGRISHQWVVQLTRPVRDGYGRLIAISVVSVLIDAADRILHELSLGANDSYSVTRDDGAFIVSTLPKDFTGRTKSLFAGVCQQPNGATRTTIRGIRSAIDGRQRLHAALCVPGTDNVVAVGLDEEAVLSDIRADSRLLLVVACGAGFAFALAGLLLSHALRRRREALAANHVAELLRADQALFRELVDNMGDALVKIDEDFRIVWASAAMRDLLGHAPQDLIGTPYGRLLHPAERRRAAERRDRLKRHEAADRQVYRFQRADGGAIWIESHAAFRRRPDEPSGNFFAVLRDVSERHALLADLQRSKAELDALISDAPAVLVRLGCDADGRWACLFASSNAPALLGESAETQQQHDIVRSSVLTMAAGLEAAYAASPTPGQTTFVFALHREGGPKRMLRVHARQIELATGMLEHICYIADETALHEAEEARRAAEQRLGQLVARSPSMLYEYRIEADGRYCQGYISANAEMVTGHTADALASWNYWSTIVDAASREAWRSIVERTLRDGGAQYDIRLLHPDGTWLTLAGQMRSTPLPDGACLLTGSLRNVTRQRETERALREAQDLLAATYEAGPGVVARYASTPGKRWRVVWLSQNIVALTGYSWEDLGDPKLVRMIFRDNVLLRRKEMLAATTISGFASWEYDFRRKDGRWLRIAENIRVLTGADGRDYLIAYAYDITERHQAAQLVALGKERLDRLLSASPGVLFEEEVTEDGSVRRTYVADALARITGWPMSELSVGNYAAFQDAATLQARDDATRRALAGGEATYDGRFRRPDGSWISFRTVLRRFERDGRIFLNGYMLDVTEARERERQIGELRANLQEAVDAGPGALCRMAFTCEGTPLRVIFASAAFERLIGCRIGPESSPTWLLEIADPSHRDKVTTARASVRAREPHTWEVRALHASGKWIWLLVNSRVLPQLCQGELEVVSYITDITQQKQQEVRLAQASKLATLGEMATSMAHELNQPLAIMSIAAENALQDIGNLAAQDRIAKRLERIHRQAQRASELIDHLRVFGRTRDDGVSSVALPGIVAGALLLAGARLRLGGVQVAQDLPADLPPVLVNPVLVEQTLLNLIVNACDAYETAPAGTLATLHIAARATGDIVVLSVADRAGGIPPDIAERIFEPFFTTKPVGKGTGLGLSFGYGVISDMGGTIEVSNKDGGAVFSISLPTMTKSVARPDDRAVATCELTRAM